MTLGEKVKLKREELGLSQEELAEKMNYKSKTSIHKIEQDITDLPLSKVKELANVLKTTPAYLMGWEKGDKREIYDFYINENLAGDVKYKNKKISIIMGDPKDKSTFKELDLNSDENIKLGTVISLIQLALEKVELTNKGRVGLENLLCDIIEYFFVPKESITPKIVSKKYDISQPDISDLINSRGLAAFSGDIKKGKK